MTMTNMRDILDLINEMSEEEGHVELHDEFDIELSEDIVIESGVIDILEDGILIEGDDFSLQLLEEHGFILEETDWSKYDEPTVNRIKKGVTKPVDTTDYDVPAYIRKKEGPKPVTGPEIRRANLIKRGILKAGMKKEEIEQVDEAGPFTGIGKMMMKHKLNKGIKKDRDAEGDAFDRMHDYDFTDELRFSHEDDFVRAGDAIRRKKRVLNRLSKKEGPKPVTGPEIRRADLIKRGILKANEEEVEESGLQAYLGKKKYGEKGMQALQKAGREGASKEKMAKIRAQHDKLDEVQVDEAKYQGREVPLGKPMQGDVKKSKVYVKGPKGNVVKVNFGDKKMRIKKSNPGRRKNFRARHNCKNPGPRWKARYWSCRAW